MADQRHGYPDPGPGAEVLVDALSASHRSSAITDFANHQNGGAGIERHACKRFERPRFDSSDRPAWRRRKTTTVAGRAHREHPWFESERPPRAMRIAPRDFMANRFRPRYGLTASVTGCELFSMAGGISHAAG